MNSMRRRTRILTILLSLVLMLTIAIPAAFADDNVKVSAQEAIQEEGAEVVEESAADPAQNSEEAIGEEADAVEAAEEPQDNITVEEISLDEEEIMQSKAKLAASNINRKILIAGLDNGGRTDLMIILCFTKENEAKIFTVARDTYMQLNPSQKYSIDGKVRDFCKCNRAGAYGGMNVLMTELNRHLDLDIKEYI
ncbi:MAG: LCP family protein, partial [Mogibacterium sp.]|nr:LCP family protein [Mogibacterium sp.]